MYWPSLDETCSCRKSSARMPSICAFILRRMSFVTSTTGSLPSIRCRQTFKIRLSILSSGRLSGSSTWTQLASTRTVPPFFRGEPSRRFPCSRRFSRRLMASLAWAPFSPSAFFNPSSSSRTARGSTSWLSSKQSRASGDWISTLVSRTNIFFI